MNRVLGTFEQGQIIFDTPAEWPDGSRVEVSLIRPDAADGNGRHEPPPGVRMGFWRALNDESTWGLNLDDSFWPLSVDETNLLLEHMDAAEPLDLTPEEIDRMEE